MQNKNLLKEKIKKKTNHTIERCKDRYGITLSDIEFRRLVNSIRYLGKPYKKRYYEVKLIKVVSNTRSIYKIFYNDTEIYCVYSKSHKCIETILPSCCYEAQQ